MDNKTQSQKRVFRKEHLQTMGNLLQAIRAPLIQ